MLASAASLAALAQLPGCATEPVRRPNLLFVLSDAHRACSLGCYGNSAVRTPNMDALAAGGAVLTSAVSSTPQCRPYRASMMTGCYAHHTGVLSNKAPRRRQGKRDKFPVRSFSVSPDGQWDPHGLPLWADSFARAGYRCGYIGKWDLGAPNVDPGPGRLGFDDFWMTWLINRHEYYDWSHCRGQDTVIRGDGSFQPSAETTEALKFMRRQQQDQPWLLVVSWGPPHQPLVPPEKYRHFTGLTGRPNVPTDKAAAFTSQKLPLYYGLIEAIDDELGRLIRSVERSGEDTIIVYTSDHGMMLGSQGLSGKELPYAESIGVPFIVSSPGRVPAGLSIDMPLGTPDILPTLAGLAGVGLSGAIDGSDFSAILRGEQDAGRQESVLLSAQEPRIFDWPGWRAVRTQRYLYARTETKPWVLFDLESDPFEQHNLVDEQRGLRDDLDALTVEQMARFGDSWRGLELPAPGDR